MVVGKGTDVSASVDGLLRGLGWVRFTGARADDARVERVVRIMMDSGAWSLVLRAFDLLLLRPEVVRWFDESVDALGNAGYDEDAARAAKLREDGKTGDADSLMARHDDLVNSIAANLRATISDALHGMQEARREDDDAGNDKEPNMESNKQGNDRPETQTAGETTDTATDVLNDGDVILAEEIGVTDDGEPILRGVALDEEPTGER